MPIAHLYKTQVYQLADEVGVPAEICERPPTTDTHALERSQEEFYFSVPFDKLDLCLYARNQGLPAEAATGLDVEVVERVYEDIERKRRPPSTCTRRPFSSPSSRAD